MQVPPKSLKDFISSVLSQRDDYWTFYNIMCLKGSCATCGGLQKLQRCIHLEITHEFGKTLVSYGKCKSITYGVKDGKELKRCELVSQDRPIAKFMSIF